MHLHIYCGDLLQWTDHWNRESRFDYGSILSVAPYDSERDTK